MAKAEFNEGLDNWREDPLGSESAEVLSDYLQLMEDTESPRVYHIWCLLAATAAVIGSHAKLRMGALMSIRPNMFVVLIGPSAIKKSTPIDIMESLLAQTSVRFGPTDSGGQRHGLMSAMQGMAKKGALKQLLVDTVFLAPRTIWQRRAEDIALFSRELGRLWGSANREMADFFLDLYDGADIKYETKASALTIQAPSVTLLGATTPSSLATMLPENAADHGVLSRTVFVYADEIHKPVPIPPDPDEGWYDLRDKITRRFEWIENNRLDFSLSEEAAELYANLYEYKPAFDDPRLISYTGRRGQHLMKVAMCLAALRGYVQIIPNDLRLAHELLAQIEPFMHKALESFGRNKAYQGRMIILQYLRSLPSHVAGQDEIVAVAAKELNMRECQEVLNAMQLNGEITIIGGRVALSSVSTELRKKRGGE